MIQKKALPEQINISDYNYSLPDKCIAKYPLTERDLSKLLVYKNNELIDSEFKEICTFLNSNDLLFFNNTKVIPARLKFNKTTGAQIEIFCLEPIQPADYALAFQSNTCTWKCIVGNLKKWKDPLLEKTITFDDKTISLYAEKITDHQTSVDIKFSWNDPSINFEKIIETIGVTPIPPYLNRESEELDKNRYQTIYSSIKGSVAAPTAGLHFSQSIFNSLKIKNIGTGELTLHVGAGTFKPVQSENILGHEMHTEYYTIQKSEIEKIILNHGNIVAVGTTTLRTLESLYYSGLKLFLSENTDPDYNQIHQWDPYRYEDSITYPQSLEVILKYMTEQKLDVFTGFTQIMIVPGYKPKSIKALITNFHQPKSTLLLLIASIIGKKWETIYQYALQHNYRFLSYGDSSLLFM